MSPHQGHQRSILGTNRQSVEFGKRSDGVFWLSDHGRLAGNQCVRLSSQPIVQDIERKKLQSQVKP